MKRENQFRYTRLAGILREQILSGYIKPGQYLLSENELCKHYEMSRTSVRKSLNELLQEGLIVKKVGQGTFVSPDLVVEESQRKILRIWGAMPSYFADSCIQSIIEAFHQDNPNVEVKFIGMPSNDFWESVRSSKEQGMETDLLYMTDTHFNEVNLEEAFLDLHEVMAPALPDLYPSLIEACTRNGALIGAPVTFSPIYLVYNPELFDKYGVKHPEPNWTRDDFLEAAKQLTLDTDGDGIVDQYGFSMSSNSTRWIVLALQNGVSFSQPFQQEPLRETLTFIHDMLYRHRTAVLNQRSSLIADAFLHHKAAMVMTSAIELAGWQNESYTVPYKVASLPFGERKETLQIANMFMIPAETQNPELAARFIQAAQSPEIQEMNGRSANFLSVLESVNEMLWDSSVLKSINLQSDTSASCRFLSQLMPDPLFLELLEEEMGLFWSGLESPALTLDRLQTIAYKPQ